MWLTYWKALSPRSKIEESSITDIMATKQKLELTWIGKENRPKLEPRILLEDPLRSYHAKFRVKSGNPQITQISADSNSNAEAGIDSGVNLRESAKSADNVFAVDP